VHTSEDINKKRNKVQKIGIRPAKAGLYHIEVECVNIATGIPKLGATIMLQEYALVVSNAISFSLIS